MRVKAHHFHTGLTDMKKIKIPLLICSILLTLLPVSPPALAIDRAGIARAAAAESNTARQLLSQAFQEECRSIAMYGAYIRAFGDTRPLSGISSAKRSHAALLKSMFKKNGWQIPENTAPKDIEVPGTLLEAYKNGLKREKETFEIYSDFLRHDLPENIKIMFSVFRTAAANHQREFERAIAGYEKNRI